MHVIGNHRLDERAASSSWTHERWGGFLLTRSRPTLLHVRLTGRLSGRTLLELDHRVGANVRPGRTTLLALDATELQHIPLAVAEELAARERRWRAVGVVACWVGLNPYLADLLVLACGPDQHLPAVEDLDALEPLLADVADQPASVVRGWLEIRSVLLH
jgi:anti-anti-sigma regulatory factor